MIEPPKCETCKWYERSNTFHKLCKRVELIPDDPCETQTYSFADINRQRCGGCEPNGIYWQPQDPSVHGLTEEQVLERTAALLERRRLASVSVGQHSYDRWMAGFCWGMALASAISTCLVVISSLWFGR